MSAPIDTKKHALAKLLDNGETNNYPHWANQARIKLKQLDLWKYIEGPESNPPLIPEIRDETEFEVICADGIKRMAKLPGNRDEVEKAKKTAEPWKKADLDILTLLIEAIPAKKGSLVNDKQHAKKAWLALRSEYLPRNSLRAQVLCQQIQKFECSPDMVVSKWVTRIRELYDELVDQDPDKMPDSSFAEIIANNIPTTNTWEIFSDKLNTDMREAKEAGDPLSSSRIIEMIKAEDWSKTRRNQETLAEVYTLDAITRKRPAPAPIVNHASGPVAKKPRVDKSLFTCNNCKRKGHLSDDCFAYGGKKCGQYPDWWAPGWRRDIHLPPHQRAPHPATQNAARVNAATLDPQGSAGSPPPGDADADVLKQEGAFYAFNTSAIADPDVPVTCPVGAIDPSATVQPGVYHDTGTNWHIFIDRAVFMNYKSIPPIHIHGFSSTLSSSAVGIGDVHLQSRINGVSLTIKLSSVLHVPSARLNLVSQGCLERRGVNLRTTGGTLTLSYNGTDLATGFLQHNNLFKLDVTPVPRDLQARLGAVPGPVSLLDRISDRGSSLDDRASGAVANFSETPGKPLRVHQDFYIAY
jgi:hypothetical protein